MTDERDICERLEDQSIDGAIYLRINAAKDIRALRYYVQRLEDELAEEEHQHAKTIIKLENAREHISDQALDIVTLGQEVGRLRETLASSKSWIDRWTKHVGNCSGSDETCTCGRAAILFEASAALAEQGEK